MIINELLDAVVETLQAVNDDDSSPYFHFVGRGRMLPQALDMIERPAAFVILMEEGQTSQDFDAMLSGVVFGVLIHGDQAPANGDITMEALRVKDSETIETAIKAKLALENQKLHDDVSPIKYLKTQSPETNLAIPFGSVMAVFSCFYAEERP
jgi:hypothetical protein